jgi:hypothetical protein
MDKPPHWIHGEWAGLIAFVLALGIAVSMVVSLIGAVLDDDGLSPEKSNLLSTVFGAAIGVIGTYIGAHGRGARRSSDRRGEETDEIPVVGGGK